MVKADAIDFNVTLKGRNIGHVGFNITLYKRSIPVIIENDL